MIYNIHFDATFHLPNEVEQHTPRDLPRGTHVVSAGQDRISSRRHATCPPSEPLIGDPEGHGFPGTKACLKLVRSHLNLRHNFFSIIPISMHLLPRMNFMLDFICIGFELRGSISLRFDLSIVSIINLPGLSRQSRLHSTEVRKLLSLPRQPP